MEPIFVAMVAIICIFIFLIFIVLLLSFVVAKKLAKPRKRSINFLIDYETREKKFEKRWLDIPFESYKLNSDFGYGLSARLYRAAVPSNKVMISLHGMSSNFVSQLKYLEMFLEQGYNVFIPDHRYCGTSGGKYLTFGAYEKLDVIKWMDKIQQDIMPKAEFSIFGESLGGATAMLVTGLDSRITKLIEYCGYANLRTLVYNYVKQKALKPVTYFLTKVGLKLFYKTDLKECDVLPNIAKNSVPMLILHSKEDSIVTYENALAIHNVRPDAKFISFETGIHGRQMSENPEKFKQNVIDFLKINDKI